MPASPFLFAGLTQVFSSMQLRLRDHVLDLERPLVMGVLNVTPDSFSDGGRYTALEAAVERGLAMVAEGALLLDIGGESTRPGASEVPIQEEISRVVPVIAALARQTRVPLSVDSRKPEVMSAALDAGAVFINDVSALRTPGALAVAAASGAGVCLMHMQGEPGSMQSAPHYEDVVAEVRQFLALRVAACNAAGIEADRIVLDPGIGFGKQLKHNLALLAGLPGLSAGHHAVLVGVSRKSLFGTLLGRDVTQRLAGGLAAATAAVLAGAKIIRTHDVAATVDAVNVAFALRQAGFKSDEAGQGG